MVEPAAVDSKMHRGERACAPFPQTRRPLGHTRVPAAKSNFLSVSINREFPSEFLNFTKAQILELAKQGSAAAKKAWKLLNDGRFDK